MNRKTAIKNMLGLAARLVLGGVFVYAGFLKAVAPAEEFAYAIESYKIMPQKFAMLSALLAPWLEIYLGVFLIAGLFAGFSALAAGAMLVFFEGLLLQALLRNLPIASCGCFGAAGSGSPAHELMQNLALLALAALAFRRGRKNSLDSLIDGHE